MLRCTAPPLLGMLDVGMVVLKVLAVAGGAVLGALVIGLLVQLIGRGVAGRQLPAWVVNVSRLLGAVAGGLAVYVWVTSPGGGGGFGGGGGGWWPFGKSNSGTGVEATQRSSPNTGSGPPATRQERPDTLEITMRGGKEAEDDQRFYVIEGEEPLDKEHLPAAIEKWKKEKKPQLKFIKIIKGPGSVTPGNKAVGWLIDWAKKSGYEPLPP
jgi:hypothetical protein